MLSSQTDFSKLREEEEKQKPKFASEDIARPRVPRFAAGSPEAAAYLEEFGYVVIKTVANEEQVTEAKNLFWKFLSHSSNGQIKRRDVKTWGNEIGQWPGWLDTGIFHDNGIGQSPFLWYLRGLPAVAKAFASIWDCQEQDLICSFDGCGVFRPWAVNPSWKTKGGWFHVDQGRAKAGQKVCIQGLVTLYDATPSTGGLCLMPGSHKYHESLMKYASGGGQGDFVKCSEYMIQNSGMLDAHLMMNEDMEGGGGVKNNKRGAEVVRPIQVQAQAGDMILWDSRTVHCNTPGDLNATVDEEEGNEADVKIGDERKEAIGKEETETGISRHRVSRLKKRRSEEGENELLRIVAYICMVPAQPYLTKKLLYERKDAVECGLTTNHWPIYCRANHSALADSSYVCKFTNDSNKFTGLSEKQRRLIGHEEQML